MDTPLDLLKRIRQASKPRQLNKSPKEKASENRQTLKLVIRSMAQLQLVGAPDEVVETIIKEIINRGLTDDSSGGTADTLVGVAVIETVTGKPAPALLPRAGEVARALLDAQATLQLAGIDDTDEARTLTDRIVRAGLRGARAKAAVREVVAPVVTQVEADQQASAEPAGGGGADAQPTPPPDQRPGLVLVDRIPSEHWGDSGAVPSESAAPAVAKAEASEASPAEQTASDASSVIDFSDIDFEPEAPTDNSLVPIEPPDPFYGPDGAAEPGTPPSTDDDILSPPPDKQGSGNQGSNNNTDDSEDGNTDDGDTTGNGDDDSQNQGGDDGSTPNNSSEDQPAASGTPNPEREEAGSGFGLQEATGGRLGGDAARRQQDRLDLLGRGGGAAGPEAGENPASGVLLTPEERANASRLLGVKAGGSVTNPAPLKDGGTAITERDLKDLVLRGNGGAGTPEVTVLPVLQPSQSPLAPPPGVPRVGGDPITGQESTGNLRALPVFQRLGAFQSLEGPRGKAAAPANTSAMTLGAAGAELGPIAPHLFGTQAGGLIGAEIRFGGLTAFQAAPLLA